MVGDILGVLVLIFAAAFMAETLTEAVFGKIVSNIPKLGPYRWTLYYVAVAVGIWLAFEYRFDLLYLLGMFVESPVEKTNLGITLTGISIGSGASYIHQFVSKFFPANKNPMV